MRIERAQLPPARIAREELGRAGEKQKPEQETAEEEDGDRRSGGEKDRKKTRLDEQLVPLVIHENLTGIGQRQIKNERADERGANKAIAEDEKAAERAGDGRGLHG